jgi:hypothetical protein
MNPMSGMKRPRPRLPALRPALAGLGAFAISLVVLLALAAQQGAAQSPPRGATAPVKPEQAVPALNPTSATAWQTPPRAEKPASDAVEEKIRQIAASGRIQQIGESSSSRLNSGASLAPGAPPILAFRYLDGQARHRFGDLDLVMDDAGH